MTTTEVLERVMRDRPGESTGKDMLRWLHQLDCKWYERMVASHEGGEDVQKPEPYSEGTEQELLIAPPHDEVYIHYLYSKIDHMLGEIDRYNLSATLFHDGWMEACKEYHRTHMPRRVVIQRVVRGYNAGRRDDPLDRG